MEDARVSDQDLQVQLEETKRLIEERGKDVARLTSKMLTQDFQISELRKKTAEQDVEIESNKETIERLQTTLQDLETQNSKLQNELKNAESKASVKVQLAEKELEAKKNELQVLRAKMFLDQLNVSIKLVPEYPDLMDEVKVLSE